MIEIKEQVNLAPYTSWLIGGPADFLCFPTNIEELKWAWLWAIERKLPVSWLGGGTNVLISDLGIRGLTIGLRKFSHLNVSVDQDKIQIQCLSGTAKSEILKVFLKYQLPPALFLAGLPGDVGGGIVMNAGVAENYSPKEFGEIVSSFTVLNYDGTKFIETTFDHQELNWQYRHCFGWQPGLITTVQLQWPMNIDPQILDKVRLANKTRLSRQPLDKPSCGSVFINPTGHKAAQLIESCGLKGTRIGNAEVSQKHANFIVNLGDATAIDTWNLMMKVKKTVLDQKAIELTTEVVRLGDWSSLLS